jgi:hypothetical protein
MKKILFLSLFFYALQCHANNIIGFRGKNEVFDEVAFKEYAKQRNLKPIIFSSLKVNESLKHIRNIQGEYELYGYSLGAVAVKQVLEYQQKNGLKMPQYVITIGAYKTVDVDFRKYRISFDNFFDDSGIGNKSPGFFLKVPHSEIQKKVNEIK